jgi:hypothetical protein
MSENERPHDVDEALGALRDREVPPGLLDGLYDDVRDAARDERFSRARMSTAFLEAPASLVAWRRAAVAATVLLTVGVFWAATNEPVGGPGRSEPLAPDEDPRYRVLDTITGVRPDVATTPASVRSVGPPVQRVRRGPEYVYVHDGNEWVSAPGVGRPRGRVGAAGR